MDQMSNLKSEQMDGSVEQQALSMIDGVVDQAVDLIVQRFPASSNKADEAKLRIKSAVHQEIHGLASQGRQM